MDKYKNVYVTGSIAYDTIMDFPNQFQEYFHPERLHQINVSFVVDRLEKQLGGTATNITYNISLISKIKDQRSKISLIGSVGKDGKDFLKFFNEINIDYSGVITDKKLYTSAGSVITDKKNNQIWGYYYGAGKTIPKYDFKKINKETDLFIISANHKNSFLYFQSEAIKYKIPYLYDPGMTLTWISDKDLEEGVMNCRYLVGNDYEIGMILKRINPTSLKLRGASEFGIITTLGEEGVEFQMKNEKLKVKSFKVKVVVDPTGAGDAWRGGFVAGLMMNYKINDCLKLGNVMASFAIEKYGTVNHKPTQNKIEKRMKSLKA